MNFTPRSVPHPGSAPDDWSPSSASDSGRSLSSTSGQHTPPRTSASPRKDTDVLVTAVKPAEPVTANTTSKRVQQFLRSGYLFDSNDLVLRIQHNQFNEFYNKLKTGFSAQELRRLSYHYSPVTGKLVVESMASPVHDAIMRFLIWWLGWIEKNQYMSSEELGYVWVSNGYDIYLPVVSDGDSAGIAGKGQMKKATGAVKVPDALFGLIDPATIGEEDTYPNIIVECAFSQSYASVLEDARQWLVRSRGLVKLVIVVKLHEMKGSRKMVDREEVAQKIAEQIAVRKMFNEPTLAETLQEAPDYDFTHHQCFEHNNQEWVGPLQGCLEFYRLSADGVGIVKEGKSYDIFDVDAADPTIKISDLLPDQFIGSDKFREIPLPIAGYRDSLRYTIPRFAKIRKEAADARLRASRRNPNSSLDDNQGGIRDPNDADYEQSDEDDRMSAGSSSGASN